MTEKTPKTNAKENAQAFMTPTEFDALIRLELSIPNRTAFVKWYSEHYENINGGDLSTFLNHGKGSSKYHKIIELLRDGKLKDQQKLSLTPMANKSNETSTKLIDRPTLNFESADSETKKEEKEIKEEKKQQSSSTTSSNSKEQSTTTTTAATTTTIKTEPYSSSPKQSKKEIVESKPKHGAPLSERQSSTLGLPTDMHDVIRIFKRINANENDINRYKAAFIEEAIDLDALNEISDEKLKQKPYEMRDGHIIKLRRFLQLGINNVIDSGVTCESQKVLGAGHYGEVFEGKYGNIPVAIKVLGGDTRSNLRQEAELLKSLKHPNCLTFYGLWWDSDRSRLTMITEKMTGNVLDLLQRDSLRSIEMLYIASDIANGVDFIHKNSIVHRDLALRNVLYQYANEKNRRFVCKIADFGLSRKLNVDDLYEISAIKEKTGHGGMPLFWTAPESFTSGQVTPKSDVWSFGILLWELYCGGKSPFEGKDKGDLYNSTKNGEPPEIDLSVPENIKDIMRSCWKKKPEERPTFEQLSETFDQIIVQQTQPTIISDSDLSAPNSPPATPNMPPFNRSSSSEVDAYYDN